MYRSEEFQMFIRGSTDYKKLVSDFRKCNYNEIAQNYRTVFKEYLPYQSSEQDERTIEEALVYMKNGLENLEKFEFACKINVDYFGTYEKQLSNLMSGLSDVNKYYSSHFGGREVDITARDNYSNPYYILLD